MKKSIIALVSFACWSIASAGEPAPSGAKNTPITRGEALLTSITATVEAVDPQNREVTLKGPLGNEVDFKVDSRVKRLDEVKVGDVVRADYYVSVVAELRRPTPEEEKNPIAISEDSARAPKTETPAGVEAQQVKVVTTIEGIDRPTQTVTIKGPQGHYLTARVQDPANLEKVRIGEHIVVTYTEALAVSLQKVEKKGE